ncbi:NACHT, LRR and PYD domains-containing protein 5 [Acomys russatus]|uniref:NACHT, LRR and PYD domains-containing protein 5 n=1 Tax=Acomys russatus TaxID=60746 RepID=UPI0021E28578|nr:NACHT, LRR and PYD domains-containing protein 5 [Acomys russatus]
MYKTEGGRKYAQHPTGISRSVLPKSLLFYQRLSSMMKGSKECDEKCDLGEKTKESSMSNLEEDAEPAPSEQEPEEEQTSYRGDDLRNYKAHVISKFDTSADVRSDDPEMKVLLDAFKQTVFRPHTVILHGRSGVGKSALARSIMLGWAQGKLLQDMSCVIFLSTREIKWTETSSLAQLISKEWPDSKAPVTKIMSQPERLLFVIDDFDHLNSVPLRDDMRLSEDWEDEQPICVLMFSLLMKALLPKSFLLITTGDTGLENLKSMAVSPLYILVEGLSATRRTQLVVENTLDDHRRMQILHSVIDNNPLFDQCQVPSICSLVCDALQLQEALGNRCAPACQTLTSLYATLVFHQLSPRDPLQSCLSQGERLTLMGLCRMAAGGVWSMRSVFYEDDLKAHGLKASEISALFHMNILPHQVGHSSEQCYMFFHLSLQDFCAALYYVLEGLEEWNEYFFIIRNRGTIMQLKEADDTRLLGMKRFLFGLMNKGTMRTLEVLLGCPLSSGVRQKLQHWVSLLGHQVDTTSPADVLDAFHYLFESQDEEFVHLALNSFEEVWLLVNRKIDLMVSSYCLQHCQNLKAIQVDVKDLFSVDTTSELCPVVPQKTQCKPLIIEWWENFCSMLSTHPNLEKLDLGNSVLNEWAMKILCLKLRDPSCNIESLTFKNAEITPGLHYLWMALIRNRHLRHLNLGNTPMKEDDMKLACEALRHPNCFLESLKLDSCALTHPCYVMLSELLNSTSHLKSLSLAKNNVVEKSMKSLGVALSSSECTLEKLILDSCDLTPVSCSILASALSSNKTLTHLCLSNNSLMTEEVRQLCQFMSNPECALQRLILNHCNIRGHSYGFLVLMLMNNRRLTHLSLTMNPIEDGGMKLLCEAIKQETCGLQELELVDCQLTNYCCEDLAHVITVNKHLKSLDLGNNALGDKGVVALCEGLNQSNSTLKRLGLEACELTSDCCEALARAISCNQNLISLNLAKNDFSTSGMLRLCSAFLSPTSNLWIIGLWKQQYYAEVRRQLEEVQFSKPHMVIVGDWYSFDEEDRYWWKS